jgi:hypothetical protein
MTEPGSPDNTSGSEFMSADPTDVPARQAWGKAQRKVVSRSSLGEFTPAADRPDPVDLLESQATTRVPSLIPVRYGRMLVSAFTFYRGAALIMANDLGSGPRTGLHAQLCGDAHLMNFGAFGTPERRFVFDINDFDETHPGPFEWDVKRLVASMDVAARDNGFTPADREAIVRQTASAYRQHMTHLATMSNLDVWYAVIDVDQVTQALQPNLDAKTRKRTAKELAKARTRTSMQAASKLTQVVDGRREFIENPPLIQRVATMLNENEHNIPEVMHFLHQGGLEYRATLQSDRAHLLNTYTFVDLAFKVVGVGSVGTRCWILLMQGADPTDLLMLQLKEAQASVLEAFTAPSGLPQHGERVVHGQRILQSASDLFLGYARFGPSDGEHTDYYIRQLRDWKGSADVSVMDPEGLGQYGAVCAAALAKGHARSGDRFAIAGYLGTGTTFDDAMVRFASAYADQNEADYEALKQAASSGRITVDTTT